jgi:hypothetical protein
MDVKHYKSVRIFDTAALLGVITIMCLGSCAAKKSSGAGSSRVAIAFPTESQLNKVSTRSVSAFAQTYDFARACFAVSVTGTGIPVTASTATCDVPVGVFQGFVPPGGSVSMEIPNGTARRLEVIAYARISTSEPCPSGTSLQGLNVMRLAQVGVIESFDAVVPDVVVEVQMKMPSQNLAEQKSLPQSCRVNSLTPLLASTAITSGRAVQTGGAFKLVGAVSGLKNEIKLTGGNYTLQMSRRIQ